MRGFLRGVGKAMLWVAGAGLAWFVWAAFASKWSSETQIVVFGMVLLFVLNMEIQTLKDRVSALEWRLHDHDRS